jgi:hypothetical protein
MKNLYKIEDELYIVDNTEEINKDTKICWCIDTSNNELVLHQGVLPAYHYKYYKKIIMTTNTSINLLCGCGKNCGAKESGVQAIDEDFLEWFVKNPSCEWVEVQDWYHKFLSCCQSKEQCYCNKKRIIIPKEEHPKQETIEEVGKFAEKRYLERMDSFEKCDFKDGVFEGYKLAQQRMFSEEDMKQYAWECVANFLSNNDNKVEIALTDVIIDRNNKQFEKYKKK